MTTPTAQPRRVLVVDRDPRVRAALTALIDATPGLEVAAATSLTELPCVLGTPAADVAVVDVTAGHPEDDLAAIRDLSARLPVVAVSAAGTDGVHAIAAGAMACCDKDGDADCLIAALTAVAPPGARPCS